MAFIESPRFPNTLAFGATGGPMFTTHVVAVQGGREQRTQRWTYPKAMYDVGLVNRSLQETKDLFAFFYAVANGKLNAFRFADPLPGEALGLGQALGTGNGILVDFQLAKQYVSGTYGFSRPIYKPVAGTVKVYLDDVLTTAFSVSLTGLITMDAAPAGGVVLTASYQFDIPVRFDTDLIQCQRIDKNAYSWPSIPLVEVRELV